MSDVTPQPLPPGTPTMGRIVLFTAAHREECPAIVTGYSEDSTEGGTISLTAFTSDGPQREFAPAVEGREDVGGRRWRWPPRV